MVSNDQILNIKEKKINFGTRTPRAALSKPGKQENGRPMGINLDDILPGTKVRVENSRMPGGVDEFYEHGKTFSRDVISYNDTKSPSTVPEALIIRMVDPNDSSNVSAPFHLPFEIDYPVLPLDRPEISQINDKLDPSDDIKFQMTNSVDESEVIIT